MGFSHIRALLDSSSIATYATAVQAGGFKIPKGSRSANRDPFSISILHSAENPFNLR